MVVFVVEVQSPLLQVLIFWATPKVQVLPWHMEAEHRSLDQFLSPQLTMNLSRLTFHR